MRVQKCKDPLVQPGMWKTKAGLLLVFVFVSLAVAVTAPFVMMRGDKKNKAGAC